MPKKSGVSDPNKPVPICWSKSPKGSNIWVKSENLWNLLSNGPVKKPPWPMNIWEVSEWISMMSSCTLMPFTEEVVKLSLPPEESITPLNYSLNPDSSNPCSWPKFPDLPTLWVVSIKYWTPEEVSSKKKSKLWEPPKIWSNATYPSLNLSDSPLLWEEPLPDKLSPNASSPIGKPSPVTPKKKDPKPLKSSPPSEKEKVSKKESPPSIISWTNYDMSSLNSFIIYSL